MAKMDKNEGKKQVFVFIMKKKEKKKKIFFMRLDYDFPHLDMNGKKVECMEGPRGPL